MALTVRTGGHSFDRGALLDPTAVDFKPTAPLNSSTTSSTSLLRAANADFEDTGNILTFPANRVAGSRLGSPMNFHASGMPSEATAVPDTVRRTWSSDNQTAEEVQDNLAEAAARAANDGDDFVEAEEEGGGLMMAGAEEAANDDFDEDGPRGRRQHQRHRPRTRGRNGEEGDPEDPAHKGTPEEHAGEPHDPHAPRATEGAARTAANDAEHVAARDLTRDAGRAGVRGLERAGAGAVERGFARTALEGGGKMALEFVGRAVVAGGIADMGLLAGGIATAATATGIGAVAIGAVAFLGDFYLNYRKTDSVSEAFNLTIQDAGKLGKFMLDAVVNVGKDVWNAAKNVFSNPSDIPGTAFKLVDFLTVGGATAVQQAFKGNFMPAADWITLGGASLAVTVYHGAKWAMENPKQAEALAGKVIKGVEDALSFAWSVVSDPKLAHDVANTTTNAAIAAHDADSGDRLASAAQTAWNDRRQLTADVQHNATGVVHHGAQVIRLATDNNASAAAVFSALPSLGAMPSLTATMTADNDATPVRPTDLTRGAYAPQARAA